MALTTQQYTRLERLRNHCTSYELILESSDGRKFLVAYTRKTGPGLANCVRIYWDELQSLTGQKREWLWVKGRSSVTSDGWRIYFTGRTERDAICNGEISRLPRIA